MGKWLRTLVMLGCLCVSSVASATAISITGPINLYDCSWGWKHHATNAAYWFEKLGQSTNILYNPDRDRLISAIGYSNLVYAIAHGNSYHFSPSCNNVPVTSSDLIGINRKPMFYFAANCDSLCEDNGYSISRVADTVVGYCRMSSVDCASCWDTSVAWQNTFFSILNHGNTTGEAFDTAMGTYPQCLGCIRIAGNTDAILKDIPEEEVEEPERCGTIDPRRQ